MSPTHVARRVILSSDSGLQPPDTCSTSYRFLSGIIKWHDLWRGRQYSVTQSQKSPLVLPCNYGNHRVRNRVAGMTELVDVRDLGSRVARRGGSSPSTRTIKWLFWR